MLSTGSCALVLLGMEVAPTCSVAPAREVSIVIGTQIGMTLLGEPGGARHLGATAAAATVATNDPSGPSPPDLARLRRVPTDR